MFFYVDAVVEQASCKGMGIRNDTIHPWRTQLPGLLEADIAVQKGSLQLVYRQLSPKEGLEFTTNEVLLLHEIRSVELMV